MSKWIFAAGAAAIALATPTLADPGGNKGKGGDRQAKSMKADRGGGEARSVRRGGGEVRLAQRDNRGKGSDKVRVRANGDRVVVRNRDNGDRVKIKGRGDDRIRIVDRDGDRIRILDRDDRRDGRRLVRFESDARGFRHLAGHCPPGLAGKNDLCLPPGQYKKIGSRLPAAFRSRLLDGPYRQWYRDDDRFTYRRDDDYIYRVRRNGGLIDALFPSANRSYSYYPVGMNYPSAFNFYNVPNQYQSFYPDGGDYAYRYGDGAIYQVNPSNNMIQSIVALLAGDLGVGQRMPLNYGAYNVPLAYRDRYYDTPDAMYRYNDGYIYQADPTTQLITAVISALV